MAQIYLHVSQIFLNSDTYSGFTFPSQPNAATDVPVQEKNK